MTVAPAAQYRILVCDDQPDVLHAMQLLLKGEGYQAITVESPRALLKAAVADEFDLIVADLNYARDTTSGEEGMDLLASLEAQGNQTPVIVMTAWGSIDLAVEAMRRGACDFIQKPWDNHRVLAAVRKQAESERRRKSEIEIAATVQQKLFPASRPVCAGIEYAGHCVAARGVGGDYYDFLDLGPGSMGFVLADVSGKGVPAALLMANLQACFRSQPASVLRNPAEMVKIANRVFYTSTETDRFATVFYAAYNRDYRKLRYVNCGHCAPLVLRSGGELERLEATATMIGAFEGWDCDEGEVELASGDTMLVYSDGVPEAADDRGDEFEEARLIAALRESSGFSAESLVREIIDRVAHFSSIRTDDVTVVAIRAL